MSKKSISFKRTIQIVLGVGFFTIGLVAVLLRRLSKEPAPVAERARAASRTTKQAARPPKPAPGLPAIPRPTPGKLVEAALKPLPLQLRAKPAAFKRGQTATVFVETLPGASCTLDAVYSTRRRPGGLEAEAAIAEADGVLEWSWKVNTTGEYVDVTVTGSLKGYQPAEATLRVKIAD